MFARIRTLAAEPTTVFEAGEALEFRAKDYQGATAAFRALATSPSTAVRAGALLRLARISRRTAHADDALRAYDDLANIPDARLSGLPADLVARRARCVLLQELGRGAELRAEARALQADLLAARWPIDRGTFMAYSAQLNQWTGVEQSDTYIGDRVVDTHILNLRKKIEAAPAQPEYLHSVRGIGYRFDG